MSDDDLVAMWRAGDAVLITNDADAIAEGLADEWVYLDGSGYTTKADLIDWIRSGRLAHHAMAVTGGLRVQRVGDVVILSARKASRGAWEGQEYEVEEHITDVMAQRDGEWVWVFTQKTALPA